MCTTKCKTIKSCNKCLDNVSNKTELPIIDSSQSPLFLLQLAMLQLGLLDKCKLR